MGDLTKNFSLDEFLVSEKAGELGIRNTPTPQHLQRLKDVTAPGMQIIRDALARSIVITSAYRNPTVNRAVGGPATSAHPQGWAVDSRAAGLSLLEYAKFIEGLMRPGQPLHGKVDQLIYEVGRTVHVSFDPRARGQVLTQRGGPGSPMAKGILA